jgi:hypothetical protein
MVRNSIDSTTVEQRFLEEFDDLNSETIFFLNSKRIILLISYLTVFVLCTRSTTPF